MNIPSNSGTLSLQDFWSWAAYHYNCILRAGSDTCVIFDQPYMHWHLLQEPDGTLVVQTLRNKDLLAEIVIDPGHVMYVESTPQEEEQVLFELVVSGESGEVIPLFHFLMAHGYDEEQTVQGRGLTH